MSIQDEIANAFNRQINKELFSSYLYLSMAAWAESTDFPGIANWLKVQAQEEISHAMILFTHVAERGGRVILEEIAKPDTEFSSVVDVFERTLKHEQFVTASINDLMALVEENKDFAARNRLEWFIEEQVEEEANASALLAQARRVGEKGQGILMLDRELAARVFVMPSLLAGKGE